MKNDGLFITTQHDDTTVMAYLESESWEVYYKKPGFPFIYAFGIPAEETPDNVFEIAIANADEYSDLFEEG